MAEEYLIKNNMIACPLYSKYAVSVDRESAYEILNDTPDTLSDNASENAEREDNIWDCVCGKKGNKGNFCTDCGTKRPSANSTNNVKVLTHEQLEEEKRKAVNEALKEHEKALKEQAKKEAAMKKEAEKILTKTVNSATNTIGREIGKKISRGILGSIQNMF